ncbi:hypothetical protein PTTW11_02454 [Pyrenophora teres f. teres]|uniref:Uncharacterized protein n=1 Tax=Pyrenophora teres f. teres TaxID=97479 RepID=A0A6S6VWN6_9PLEO|nr:hypothetical protein PTTW11_02454 [Pyrenophora teres f. teres]
MLLTYPRGASAILPYLSSSPVAPTATDGLSSWLHATMFVTALVNLVYVGPRTTEVMGLRKHQETRDGKKSYDAGPHSKEMQALNKQFGILHGVSTLINLAGLGAMIWYGAILGEGLTFLANLCSTECNTGFSSQQDNATEDKAVQYRQLISRATTQRLHSTSLDNLAQLQGHGIMDNTVEAWELRERGIARKKAQAAIQQLGIPWDCFVHDIENASAEVHVLTPTRYTAPPGAPYANHDATETNARQAYMYGDTHTADRDIGWKKTHAAVFEALRMLGRTRLQA